MIIVLMSTFFNVIFPNCLLLESRGHSPTNTQMGRRRRSQKDESLIDVGGKMYSNESLLFRYVYAALALSLSLQYVFVTCPTLQCFFHRIVLVASNIKTQGISEAFRKQDIWQNALEGASIGEKILIYWLWSTIIIHEVAIVIIFSLRHPPAHKRWKMVQSPSLYRRNTLSFVAHSL